MANSKGIFGKSRDQESGMENDDQKFLNQIEQNIRSKDDEKEDARKEAEQRAREMDRIRQASVNQKLPGVKKAQIAPEKKANPLESDPRYKEYFERLNRQKGGSSTTPPAGQPTASKSASTQTTIGPGSIVRFDDGSIGVYKDAVSGKDYALFYFLQPDGQFVPEGVFLQCYQAKVIGALPENYFSKLRDDSEWNRDLIVFHMSDYDNVKFLDSLTIHDERKPKNTTPVKTQSVPQKPANEPQPQKAANDTPTAEPTVADPTPTQTSSSETPAPQAEKEDSSSDGLVRGRKFQIKYGGKKWEAVYWSNDSDGSIIAHSTHGNWSLMRLDLERFADSLELGNLIEDEIMTAITSDVDKT